MRLAYQLFAAPSTELLLSRPLIRSLPQVPEVLAPTAVRTLHHVSVTLTGTKYAFHLHQSRFLPLSGALD